jgi:hypothetical protein
MELLNILRAQAVWLFDANDLNPRGKHFLPELVEWLKETYKFRQAPKSFDDLDDTKGLAFKQGAFQLANDSLTVEFTIYTDGLIANTYSSTDATDLFLHDILWRAAREFDLKYADDLVRSKMYLSEVVVRLDGVLSKLNSDLTAFADRISRNCKTQGVGPFEVSGVTFSADVSSAARKFAPFSLERRENTPFSENRYYSKASLPTDQHFSLLQDFDTMLVKV